MQVISAANPAQPIDTISASKANHTIVGPPSVKVIQVVKISEALQNLEVRHHPEPFGYR